MRRNLAVHAARVDLYSSMSCSMSLHFTKSTRERLPSPTPHQRRCCAVVSYPPVQAECVPLEDELEALCRLHAARAEVALSGDLECFIGVAPTVEAFAFREDSDEEEEVSDFTPPPAMFSAAPPVVGDGDGGGGGGATAEEKNVARLEDGRRRRLAALENCLDAFDRFVNVRIMKKSFYSRS